jgi:hypothetical protein
VYVGNLEPDGSIQVQSREFAGAAAVDIRAVVTRNAVEVRLAKSASVVSPAKTPKAG